MESSAPGVVSSGSVLDGASRLPDFKPPKSLGGPVSVRLSVLKKESWKKLESCHKASFSRRFDAAAATAAAATTAGGRQASQNYTLLTGYEDTEMPEDNQALSGTQYGTLN